MNAGKNLQRILVFGALTLFVLALVPGEAWAPEYLRETTSPPSAKSPASQPTTRLPISQPPAVKMPAIPPPPAATPIPGPAPSPENLPVPLPIPAPHDQAGKGMFKVETSPKGPGVVGNNPIPMPGPSQQAGVGPAPSPENLPVPLPGPSQQAGKGPVSWDPGDKPAEFNVEKGK